MEYRDSWHTVKPNENLIKIFENICSALKTNISPTDIDYIKRVQPYNNNSMRAIILKFKLINHKHEILALIKQKRHLYLSEVDSSYTDNADNQSHKRLVFINCHLSPLNSKIYKQLRELKKTKTIKYAWCKNGKVFARISDNSEIIYIDSIEKLNRLSNNTVTN